VVLEPPIGQLLGQGEIDIANSGLTVFGTARHVCQLHKRPRRPRVVRVRDKLLGGKVAEALTPGPVSVLYLSQKVTRPKSSRQIAFVRGFLVGAHPSEDDVARVEDGGCGGRVYCSTHHGTIRQLDIALPVAPSPGALDEIVAPRLVCVVEQRRDDVASRLRV